MAFHCLKHVSAPEFLGHLNI